MNNVSTDKAELNIKVCAKVSKKSSPLYHELFIGTRFVNTLDARIINALTVLVHIDGKTLVQATMRTPVAASFVYCTVAVTYNNVIKRASVFHCTDTPSN